jgi:tRNA threonylcarbamoyl adenosine modification protein YjeE
MAEAYVEINEIASNLYSNFLPGPITVISNSKHILDPRLESAQGTLGVRIPKYDFALELIRAFGKPITATSANTSGKKEPYSLEDWTKYTTESKQSLVSLFLDAGKLEDRPTSTVVDTTLNEPSILRQGEIIVADITGQSFASQSVDDTQQIAQNILKKHLSLSKSYPLILALQGPLGVGKTHFTQGLAELLGIEENVNSPTYTLMKEYVYQTPKYEGTLYHLDTWRLENPAELESTLHFSTLLMPGNIIVLEWPQKASEILASYKDSCAILYIDLKETGETSRKIKYELSIPDWS